MKTYKEKLSILHNQALKEGFTDYNAFYMIKNWLNTNINFYEFQQLKKEIQEWLRKKGKSVI